MYEIFDRQYKQGHRCNRMMHIVTENGLVPLAKYVWTQEYGEDSIDSRDVIWQLDGDYTNCNLDNLILLTCGEAKRLATMGVTYESPGDLVDFAIALVKLISMIDKRMYKNYYCSFLKHLYRKMDAEKAEKSRNKALEYYYKNHDDIQQTRHERKVNDPNYVERCRKYQETYRNKHRDEIKSRYDYEAKHEYYLKNKERILARNKQNKLAKKEK